MGEAAREWHRLRLWRVVGLGLVVAIVTLSLVPPSDVPGAGLLPDKVGHILAYGVLMGWHVQLAAPGAGRRRYGVAFLVLGIALEGAQAWTGYRTFELMDILANAVGIGLGWLVSARWLPGILRRIDNALVRGERGPPPGG